MKNITFYILLICAVNIINSARHEKKAIKKKLPKLTDENLEEEARRDIEKLLKDTKPYHVDDDDDYHYSDTVPTKTYGTSKTRTQFNHNEWLINQIAKIINKLDKSVQRKNINRDKDNDRKSPWFDRPHLGRKKKPALRNRYQLLMKNMLSNHHNFVKERVNTKIYEDDRPFSARGSQFEQLMKSLATKHSQIVQERFTDKYAKPEALRKGKKHLRQHSKPTKIKLPGPHSLILNEDNTAFLHTDSSVDMETSPNPDFVQPNENPALSHYNINPAYMQTNDNPADSHPNGNPAFAHYNDNPAYMQTNENPAFTHYNDNPAYIQSNDHPAYMHTNENPAYTHTNDEQAYILTDDNQVYLNHIHKPFEMVDMETSPNPDFVPTNDTPAVTETKDKPAVEETHENPTKEKEIIHPMEDLDSDVNFDDLLAGKYLRQELRQGLRQGLRQRARNKYEDTKINVVLRNGNLYYDKPDPRFKMSSRTRSSKQRRYDNRFRRSPFTQAGYTQDPDTCKTYNDNLMKLWANLSKLMNITDQPNERALHNIAIMIQAYLDHQNSKPTTESYKVKPEPPRDRIEEVILKVKKLLEDDEASSNKISRTIIKYIKPFYGDVENSDCQQVNEESLNSSIDLLHRNYMENVECRNEDDGSSLNLRKRGPKNMQPVGGKWQTANGDKPDINSILGEDELYKEINKGQVPRQRPRSDFGRTFKRSKTTKEGPLSRSTGQTMKASGKPRVRAKLHNKPVAKKLRKSLLKTDADKSKCEKYAIRKFTMALRPVIDRFMSLLECQLDNTLRSLNYDKVSMNPFYLYASKYESKEDISSEEKKTSTKKTRKNSGRITHYIIRKSQAQNRYDLSNENDNSLLEQTDEYSYSKQISTEQVKVPAYVSDVLDSFKKSKDDEFSEFDVKYDDDTQTPKNEDYEIKTRSDNTNNSLKSKVKADQNNNNNNNSKHYKKTAESSAKTKGDEGQISFNMIYEETVPDTDIKDDRPLSTLVYKNKHAMNNVNTAESTEKISLRSEDRSTDVTFDENRGGIRSFESMKDFLRNAHEASLRTPEFAVPFSLSTNQGYVELTHLVKYPKIIVYRPQFIVKNTMPYEDFLKTINNINMTNDEVRLMKIVRHLPDNTVTVLFETEDFEAPLEVRNFKDTRRWDLSKTAIDDLKRSRTVETKQSDKTIDNDDDKDSDISVDPDQVNSNTVDNKTGSDKSVLTEKTIGRQFTNSDNIPTLDPNYIPLAESKYGKVPRTGLLSKISSGLTSGITSGINSGIMSSISSTIGSGIDSTKNLVSNLNPIESIKSSSLIQKIFPSLSNSEPIPPLDTHLDPYHEETSDQLDTDYLIQPHISHSHNHYSEPFVPIDEIVTMDLQKISPDPSKESAFKELWNKWKLVLLNRLQSIIGKMTSIASKINRI